MAKYLEQIKSLAFKYAAPKHPSGKNPKLRETSLRTVNFIEVMFDDGEFVYCGEMMGENLYLDIRFWEAVFGDMFFILSQTGKSLISTPVGNGLVQITFPEGFEE